jgi:hypothetical protein
MVLDVVLYGHCIIWALCYMGVVLYRHCIIWVLYYTGVVFTWALYHIGVVFGGCGIRWIKYEFA